MKIFEFPDICQNLEGNSYTLNNNILSSEYGFSDNRYIPGQEGLINVSLTVSFEDLIKFENFFYVSTDKGASPFYALDFKFSERYNGDYIFMFMGGYKSSHIGLSNYKITFIVKIVQ